MEKQDFYLLIVITLFVIQIYQMITIDRIKKELDQLWDQISVLTAITSKKLVDALLKKKEEIDGKEKKA
jgi:cobalamin biosynthesis Co2+ chelatase CbiK